MPWLHGFVSHTCQRKTNPRQGTETRYRRRQAARCQVQCQRKTNPRQGTETLTGTDRPDFPIASFSQRKTNPRQGTETHGRHSPSTLKHSRRQRKTNPRQGTETSPLDCCRYPSDSPGQRKTNPRQGTETTPSLRLVLRHSLQSEENESPPGD